MTIKIYIHKDQLYNFLIMKEPVTLINEIINSDYFEMHFDYRKLEFNEYKTYTSVEIRKNFISRFFSKKKKRK